MDVFSLFQAKTMRLAVSFQRKSRNISARNEQYRGGHNTHYHEDADDDLVQNDDGGDDDGDDDGDYGDDDNGVQYWGDSMHTRPLQIFSMDNFGQPVFLLRKMVQWCNFQQIKQMFSFPGQVRLSVW